jgi:hypothetical protein
VIRALVVIAIAFAPGAARADCARDADALRAHLTSQAHGVRMWNTLWAIGFGVAAAGQFALAATKTNPLGAFDRDFEESLYVGGAKATIGFASRVVMPLRVDIPGPDADRCHELAQLRASLTKIAKDERQTFWLTHLGGLALNLTGAVILWERRSFTVGAVSFATSFPIGPIGAYTMPRGSWHRWRDERGSWSIALVPHDGGWTLGAGGSF